MFIRNDMDVSYVRVFHASPDAPPVDIYVNEGLAFKNLSFKEFSEYVQLPMGEYKIEVFPAGQKELLYLHKMFKYQKKKL